MKGIKLFFRLFVVSIPLFLFLIPESIMMDIGSHLCIIKNMTGHACPGCGTTRAIWSVLHFRFVDAWNFNHGIIIVFPLLVFLWFRYIWKGFVLSRVKK